MSVILNDYKVTQKLHIIFQNLKKYESVYAVYPSESVHNFSLHLNGAKIYGYWFNYL